MEHIVKTETRWEKNFQDLKSNQDHLYEEIKTLKTLTMDSKKDILNTINSKVLTLGKGEGQNQKPVPVQQKKKILFVGDSLSRKLNLSVVKNITNMDIKRAEAFIVGNDDPKAKIPSKNFVETVPRELENENVSTLIIQGGTNEISNLDVRGNIEDKIEAMKEEVRVSSKKLFNLAEESLKYHDGLEKVIILKRMFRCDTIRNDPSQIRAKMSEFGNRVLEDIWLTKGCPKNIIITGQHLECEGDLRKSRFGLQSAKDYDGIHLRGELAVQHYTGSIINVLLDNLPELRATPTLPVNLSQPGSYANVVKNGTHHQQSKFNPRRKFHRQTFNQAHQAQPKFVPDGVGNAANFKNPTTGTNNTPLGERFVYNVNTQNRFTSNVSGN